MFGWLFSCCLPVKPVETVEEALMIAQTAIHKKCPNYDTSNQHSDLWYDEKNGIWRFRYFTNHAPDEPIFGGIGPGVEIRKSDGKITFLKGQK
ncbi:MAG: hypothetical protein IJJ04_02955 [Clostridia bacterium]|nr:hypothetical protein [Clostridia bacterium]